MPPKLPLNVQSFPRPPLLERTSRHLQVKYKGDTIAETKEAYWVLETHHAPTYYFPLSSLKSLILPTSKSTYCEWKGHATYYSINVGGEEVKNRVWGYDNPSPGFEKLKDYVSFYVGPWDCYVDEEKVEPQPGDFYGGWTTSELVGIVKGSKETRWM